MANKAQPKKRDGTAARIIKALGETQGLMTVAAQKAGVSYTTIRRYVLDYPAVAEAKEAAQERLLDFAENQLFKKIKDGETAALLFFLKTQGKKRGYIERSEYSGPDGGPIQVDTVKELTDDQLAVIAASEIIRDNARKGGGRIAPPKNGPQPTD